MENRVKSLGKAMAKVIKERADEEESKQVNTEEKSKSLNQAEEEK